MGAENGIHFDLWAQLVEEVNWVQLRASLTGKPSEGCSSWSSLSLVWLLGSLKTRGLSCGTKPSLTALGKPRGT